MLWGVMPADSTSVRGLWNGLGTQKRRVRASGMIPYPCRFDERDVSEGSQRGLETCFRSHLNHYPPWIWTLFR